jgi:hypothetical protein
MPTSDSAFGRLGASGDGPYHQAVSPQIGAGLITRAWTRIAVLALMCVLVGACAGATFDPSGPCSADGRAAGAYPELEALAPKVFDGRPPDKLDSGRNCTPGALATLAVHGVSELRFAGATWDLGPNSGVTLAVFDAPGLKDAWIAEFFEAGARTARRVETVDVGPMQLPDGPEAIRIDALNGESYQTVVVWPDAGRVRVALIASFIREIESKDAHEGVVNKAIEAAFGS